MPLSTTKQSSIPIIQEQLATSTSPENIYDEVAYHELSSIVMSAAHTDKIILIFCECKNNSKENNSTIICDILNHFQENLVIEIKQITRRDDRIVDFYYPILSCFWKMISDQNPVLVENILSVSESVLWCTTYIFVLCLFCLVRQNNCWSYNCWSYFAFSWTRLAEIVTWQVRNTCPT